MAGFTGHGEQQKEEKTELPIPHTPAKIIPHCWRHGGLPLLVSPWILILFTDNLPWFNAFTTALSLIGTWMLARQSVEQWRTWVAIDVVSSGLYLYKALHFTAGLYVIYSIVAVSGYLKWKRMIYESQ